MARPHLSLQSPNPQIDPAELLELLRTQFHPQAQSVRHLSGERDLNFLVNLEGLTERFVLKVSDVKENPAALALQNATMEHLARHQSTQNPQSEAQALNVQRIHRWRNGAHMLELPGEGGTRLARVLGYLPGRPLHEAPSSAAQRHSIGWVLGRLDRALEDFDHPVVTNEALYWDIHRTAELVEWLPSIADPQSRAFGEQAFAIYLQEVQPLLPELPQQFIHNDFNPYNLLVDPTDTDRVCGVLDFGDMVYGPRVFDAAVGASYQAHDAQRPRLDSLVECMRGYQQANPLTLQELQWVPLLAAVRCAITLCITERRAQWFPENRTYILRNHGIASAGLRTVMEPGPDAAARHLLQALQGSSSDICP